jgi:uncharacterized membrane protein
MPENPPRARGVTPGRVIRRARHLFGGVVDRLRRVGRRHAWAVAGLAFLLALLAAGLALAELSEPPELVLFVGRFHPVIVHFPIGLLVLAALLEACAALHRPLRGLRHATTFVLVLGAVSAVAAVIAGYSLSLEGGYDPELLRTHMWLGIAVAASAVAASLLKIRPRRRRSRGLQRIYAGVLLSCVGTLLLAGYFGGSLTHGTDYLTYHLPAPLQGVLGVTEARAPRARITDIDSAYVYRELIASVFEARCTSCHNPGKRQGGLRLDSPSELMIGGDHGVVVVAGSPEQSELLRRITLPPGTKEAMPPGRARPLDVGETELIRWWIAHGASFEHRVADIAEMPTAVATLLTRLAPPRPERRTGIYALAVAPADPHAITELWNAGLGIGPIALDVELLEVTTRDLRDSFGDRETELLLPVTDQIAWLDLSGTRVGDASMSTLAKMPNLTRLNLRLTAVSDTGLQALSGLPNLEYLNLFGTHVSDAGLEHLAGLASLRSLYLWQTAVTADGVAKLKAKRPGVEVVLGAEPPIRTLPRSGNLP